MRNALDEYFGLPEGGADVYLDVLGGNSQGAAIEAQEARGQAKACKTQALPCHGTSGAARDNWERMGFVFGEPDSEGMFVAVTFPEGWSLRPTGHSMWSDVVDGNGRVRAKMFYKAAFYDRSAAVHIARRYGFSTYAESQPGQMRVTVEDCGKVIHEITAPEPAEQRDRYPAREKIMAQATAWLAEQFPLWENPLAYWEPE